MNLSPPRWLPWVLSATMSAGAISLAAIGANLDHRRPAAPGPSPAATAAVGNARADTSSAPPRPGKTKAKPKRPKRPAKPGHK